MEMAGAWRGPRGRGEAIGGEGGGRRGHGRRRGRVEDASMDLGAFAEAEGGDSKVSTIVEVDLGNRSYPIYIGFGFARQTRSSPERVPAVTNTTIASLYRDKVIKALTHGNYKISVESVILPDGEANMKTLMKVFDSAIESRMDQHCTIVALGGGVIGDMRGFAAAAFLRGVNFIQILTTLIAQVLWDLVFMLKQSFTSVAAKPPAPVSDRRRTCTKKSALTGVGSGGDPPMPKLERWIGRTGKES